MTSDEIALHNAISERNKEIDALTKKNGLYGCIIFFLALFCAVLLYSLFLMDSKVKKLSEEVAYYQEIQYER